MIQTHIPAYKSNSQADTQQYWKFFFFFLQGNVSRGEMDWKMKGSTEAQQHIAICPWQTLHKDWFTAITESWKSETRTRLHKNCARGHQNNCSLLLWKAYNLTSRGTVVCWAHCGHFHLTASPRPVQWCEGCAQDAECKLIRGVSRSCTKPQRSCWEPAGPAFVHLRTSGH